MSKNALPVFKSAFVSAEDEHNGMGASPVVFDILGPDYETSILPNDVKMVLHVNPSSMNIQYQKTITRIQTRGGVVEQHWGEAASTISFEMVTGGFKRLFVGMMASTGGGVKDIGGTRRDTIAYDKYLDLLALFHNNGSVYDTTGSVVLQGIIKITFDGGVYLGWFSDFNVNEDATQPFMFNLTANFTVYREVMRIRSNMVPLMSGAMPREVSNIAQGVADLSETWADLGALKAQKEVGG